MDHTGVKPAQDQENLGPTKNARVLTCRTCRVTSSRVLEMIRHMKESHNEQPHLCTECYFASCLPGRVLSHMYSHTDERPHQCPVCESVFESNSKLERHSSVHKDNKVGKFKCNLCKYSSNKEYLLAKHAIAVHGMGEKPYRCTECSFGTIYKTQLNQHMLYNHTSLQNSKSYQCEHCDATFTVKPNLSKHMAYHKQIYKCHLCEQKFDQRYDLSQHLTKEHPNGSLPLLHQCNECDFTSKYSATLEDHVKHLHPGASPYGSIISGVLLTIEHNYSKRSAVQEEIHTPNIADDDIEIDCHTIDTEDMYSAVDSSHVIEVSPHIDLSEEPAHEEQSRMPAEEVSPLDASTPPVDAVATSTQDIDSHSHITMTDIVLTMKVQNKTEVTSQITLPANSVENIHEKNDDSDCDIKIVNDECAEKRIQEEEEGTKILEESEVSMETASSPGDSLGSLTRESASEAEPGPASAMSIHTQGRFSCQHCEHLWSETFDLISHMRDRHRDIQHKCDHRPFVSPEAQSDSEEKVFKCIHCTYTSPFLSNLKLHQERFWATIQLKRFNCTQPNCAVTSLCRNGMNEHLKWHEKPWSFTCCKCYYSPEGDWQQRIALGHEDTEETIDKETRMTEDDESSFQVASSHDDSGSMADEVDSDQISNDLEETGSFTLDEDDADAEISKDASSITSDQCVSEVTDDSATVENQDQRLKCLICSHSWLDISDLIDHMRKQHWDVQEKCDHVPLITQNDRKTDSSTTHMVQSEKKLFKCIHCTYRTPYECDLERHEAKFMTPFTPYKCSHCIFTSVCRRGRDEHQNGHLKLVKFTCKKCFYTTRVARHQIHAPDDDVESDMTHSDSDMDVANETSETENHNSNDEEGETSMSVDEMSSHVASSPEYSGNISTSVESDFDGPSDEQEDAEASSTHAPPPNDNGHFFSYFSRGIKWLTGK